jgi:hypothetical protein
MVVSILVALVFLVDLILPFAGMASMAPFGHHTGLVTDAILAVCAGVLAYLSWATLREQ